MDSDEVRKRKEYAEKKVKERHAALRKEAEERRKHTVEHRESFRVQSQLKREQVLIQKRMQQLNEDEERKKVTLAKQHEATSRIAAITKSPKSFAFGSSTPRTLAYLDNLPKSEQQYDKKLRPLEGSLPASSPTATSPVTKSARHMLTPSRAPPAAHKPAPTMTSMTSSMYVTSSAPPTRHAKPSIKPVTAAAPPKRISTGMSPMMTQSFYTPTSRPATTSRLSMARQNRGSTPTSSRATPAPPVPSSRRSMNVQKPPAPRRSGLNSKPETQKTVVPVVEAIEQAPAVETAVEDAQILETVIEKHVVAPIVEETPTEPADEQTKEINEISEKLLKLDEETPREIEKEVVLPEMLTVEPVQPEHVEEQQEVEHAEPEVSAPESPVPVEAVNDVPTEIPEPAVEGHGGVVIPHSEPTTEAQTESVVAPEEDSEDHEEKSETPVLSEIQEKEDLVCLDHETSESNAGSSVNTSLADELLDVGVQQNISPEPIESSKPEVIELNYPLPVHVAAEAAVNDLVDVFGNDFINENPPQRIVDFDEDADSGKASPTSSETSSTTDEVTPRSVIEEVKPVAPRVLPLVRSAEDIAKKEKEARETEERKSRLAAILAKTRGMASPVTNTLPPPASTINSTQSPVTSPPTPPSPMPTEQVSPTPSSSALPPKPEESTEKTSNESGAASDVLARVAAKTNLPSLQKVLQRKQGSNPSLQTSESTGGEIY